MSIDTLNEPPYLPDAFAIERRARALQARYLQKLAVSGSRAVARTLAALFLRLRTYVERRQALAQLSQLDDRLLADIGLSRSTLLGQLLEAESVHAEPPRSTMPVVTTPADIGPAVNTNRPARAA